MIIINTIHMEKDWRDPVAYDMTINSDRVGRDKAVDLICQYRKIKFGEDA